MNIISNICENLYLKLLSEVPQMENDEIIWILNGSVLCNILSNVEEINNKIVSDKLKKKFEKFVRNPKGDIDICYKADRVYKFDLNSKEVLDFYSISDEKRTYNFVDSNSELIADDIAQLCKYKTSNGLEFYAKMPQYLFLYKFKEFVAIFHNELLINDIDTINLKRKNIIHDVNALYEISCEYYGLDNTHNLLFEKLKDISGFFHDLYESEEPNYNILIESTLKIISDFKKRKIK